MEFNKAIITNLPEVVDILAMNGTREVYLNGKKIDISKSAAIWNHSPDGFNWGYAGSGPAQLALAILLELLPTNYAKELHQDFKFKVISKWKHDSTIVARIKFRTIIEELIDAKSKKKKK